MWLCHRLDVQGNMVQFSVWTNDIALLHGALSHLKPRSMMSGGMCYLPYDIMGMHMDGLTFTFISVPALTGHRLQLSIHKVV